MATSLLLACGLNDYKLAPFMFLREDVDIDGTFLISCILAQRLKIQNIGIILTCFHHTYQHYCNAGMKLGSNLNSSKNNGSLKIIEPFNNRNINIITNKNNNNNINGNNNNNNNINNCNNNNNNINNNNENDNILLSHYLICSDEILINKLWNLIIETYAAEYLKTKSATILIIDDISFLLNLGITENLIIRFCTCLHIIQEKIPNLYVIIKLNASPIYEQLSNNLEDLADLEIRIDKMKSGNFMDIDGKLEILKKQIDCGRKTKKEILYKVNERNVKIFAPGEIGVKI